MIRLLIDYSRRALTRFKLKIVNGVLIYFPGFVKAIVSRDQATVNQIGIVKHALSFSLDPIATLNFLIDESGYSGSVLWAGIVKASANKKSLLLTLFEGRASIIDKELRLRIELQESLRSGVSQRIDFLKIIDEYMEVVRSSDKPKSLQGLLAALIVVEAPVENIDYLLIKIRFSPESLTEFLKVKFLRRIAQLDEKNIYNFWEKRLASILSRPARLKVSLVNASIYHRGSEFFSSLEKEFISLNFNISEKYRDEVSDLYKQIPAPNNYLAARFDLDQQAKLSDTIINAVNANRSFSYIRLGDGECYGFADNIYVNEDGESRQEEHWWGELLDSVLREKLQLQFRCSIQNADMIGVPTVLRLIRDFNLSFREDYSVNSLVSRIMCVMKAAPSYFNKKIIVEDQSNLFLFDELFIERVFNAADKVCVVSGVKSDLIEHWAPDSSKLHCIEIPTHRLLRNGDIGSDTMGVLPHVYESYLESIKLHAGPKVVFLVSAGFIGKTFIAEAAKHGSVALDIGQTLVSLVGNKRVSE